AALPRRFRWRPARLRERAETRSCQSHGPGRPPPHQKRPAVSGNIQFVLDTTIRARLVGQGFSPDLRGKRATSAANRNLRIVIPSGATGRERSEWEKERKARDRRFRQNARTTT